LLRYFNALRPYIGFDGRDMKVFLIIHFGEVSHTARWTLMNISRLFISVIIYYHLIYLLDVALKHLLSAHVLYVL